MKTTAKADSRKKNNGGERGAANSRSEPRNGTKSRLAELTEEERRKLPKIRSW